MLGGDKSHGNIKGRSFEQRLEEPYSILQKNFLGRGSSHCKGMRARAGLVG